MNTSQNDAPLLTDARAACVKHDADIALLLLVDAVTGRVRRVAWGKTPELRAEARALATTAAESVRDCYEAGRDEPLPAILQIAASIAPARMAAPEVRAEVCAAERETEGDR